MEFLINQFLSLKLENGITMIYVGEEQFLQCKFLLLEIPVRDITALDDVKSIDEAAQELGRSLEPSDEFSRVGLIPPETEFWGHCSNLQVWYENDYNTKLLHSNLAFPLLKKLTEAGDLLARRVFKDEIAKRYNTGIEKVQKYLIINNYLEYLSPSEREILFGKESSKFKALESYVGYRIKIIPSCKSRRGVRIQNRNIIGLHLYGKDSKKKNKLFPYQIKYFKNLKNLYLENFLSLTIPKWIENLKNLKRMRLSQNHLVAIPRSIGKLVALNYLSLTLNFLDKLPKEIELLENLKELDLSYNHFKKFPEQILGLNQLENLDLSHNQLKVIPSKIGSMPSLKSLGLSDNLISSLPHELLDMPNIEKVFIGDSNIKMDEEFKKELKKKKIKIFPSGLLEFETFYRNDKS